MKIAYTGPNSYVGKYLKEHYGAIPIWADIRNRSETMEAMQEIQPDIVIHLAAKTDVDYCEDHQKEAETVNLWGTANIADVCSKFKCNVVMLSTFQVFSGKRWIGGYTEKDKPSPVNYYGMTKMAAEAASKIYNNMKIVRAGYLFDYHRLEDRIFELDKKEVSYPTFQKRSFMHLQYFCDSLINYYIPRFAEMSHLLHIGNSDTVSWYDFMVEVSKRFETDFMPIPRKTEIPDKVARPHNAGLSNSLSYKFGFPKYSQRWPSIP